jgi:hypothetical protein
MILTPKERYTVVTALVEAAAREKQSHGGYLGDRLPGESMRLPPGQMEDLARRIEQEGEPNGDLVG